MRLVVSLAVAMVVVAAPASARPVEWHYTEGGPGGGRYSPLTDIDKANVGDLEVAWTYRHGDVVDRRWRPDRVNRSTAFEGTPIVVDGRLFLTTPTNRVVALNAETGAELWSYDPEIDLGRFFANMIINRGVAYWRDERAIGPCSRRLFMATLDARLIALDAASGILCANFGEQGAVDLRRGIEPLVDDWELNNTSPPTVVGDVVVVGSSIADTIRRVGPPGDVRGFDARTGALLWTFHTIPAPDEPGAETWEKNGREHSGHANVWSTMTADLERGLVFLPVATAGPDFYGGDRLGDNLYANSVVALRAATGERVWHFQTVHHDIWDYDLAAPPNVVRVEHGGREIDAVAQATKTGFVFLLDRDTGKPLFPVEERPVPASDVPGERAAPTQPFPLRPPALVSQRITEADLWDHDPERLERCRAQLAGLRNEGLYTPPSLRGSVIHPYTAGGANWSGAGWDPERRLLFVPVNNKVHVVRLKELPEDNVDTFSVRPLRFGLRGIWWLLSGRGTGLRYQTHPLWGRSILSVDGVPCNRPPWGSLVAVDLDAGSIRWNVPTGAKDGAVGLSSFGPPLVTRSGIVFHAGTADLRLRAHDADNGAVLASFPLPAGLHAGPITYKLTEAGKQFLVIAPGGHVGADTPLGDWVIAYTLPDAGG